MPARIAGPQIRAGEIESFDAFLARNGVSIKGSDIDAQEEEVVKKKSPIVVPTNYESARSTFSTILREIFEENPLYRRRLAARRFKEHEVLFCKGEQVSEFFILRDGLVGLWLPDQWRRQSDDDCGWQHLEPRAHRPLGQMPHPE